jgi:bifunctional DNase/RNase
VDRVEVEILGISNSTQSNGGFALILKETEGIRRLPIVIGAPEAQAIALELEGITPQRPMTHDLVKNLIEILNDSLSEIVINDLNDGTFYARLILEKSGEEIDSRPSDAIALAVRFRVPMFVSEDVMKEASFTPDDAEETSTPSAPTEEEDGETTADQPIQQKESSSKKERKTPKTRFETLRDELEKAIANEDYERAAILRDELADLTNESSS